MIELLNVGDRVEMGGFRVLSRFRGAVAFVGSEASHLAVLVDESKGAGPCQMVVRGCDFTRVETLLVQADRVAVDGVVLSIRGRYCSRLTVQRVDSPTLVANLRALHLALLQAAPARSIVFATASNSAFEAAAACRFREGINLLLAGELEDGARALAGLGFGLTPSGDDFLAGFLLGMFALGAPLFQRRRIFESARGPNPFSESLLRCAVDGCCIEPAQSLIHALFAGTDADVARHTVRLTAVGASSGADLAVGLHRALGNWRTASTTERPKSGCQPISPGVST